MNMLSGILKEFGICQQNTFYYHHKKNMKQFLLDNGFQPAGHCGCSCNGTRSDKWKKGITEVCLKVNKQQIRIVKGTPWLTYEQGQTKLEQLLNEPV